MSTSQLNQLGLDCDTRPWIGVDAGSDAIARAPALYPFGSSTAEGRSGRRVVGRAPRSSSLSNERSSTDVSTKSAVL